MRSAAVAAVRAAVPNAFRSWSGLPAGATGGELSGAGVSGAGAPSGGGGGVAGAGGPSAGGEALSGTGARALAGGGVADWGSSARTVSVDSDMVRAPQKHVPRAAGACNTARPNLFPGAPVAPGRPDF